MRITDLFARPDVDTGHIPVTITVRNDTTDPISVSVQLSAGPANEETALAAAVLTIEGRARRDGGRGDDRGAGTPPLEP